MARSNEPLWWAPFMAGAGVAALLMPVTIVITSVAVAAGWITEDRLWSLLSSPLVRLFLFVLITLALFHAAHRLRFVLIDLGLKAAREFIAVVCYGIAILGALLTALLTLRVWPS
jgi:fumarate reductase subunit D